MKTKIFSVFKGLKALSLFLSIFTANTLHANSLQSSFKDTLDLLQFKGKVIDSKSKKGLSFTTISLVGSNISTVSNSEGDFSIKIPREKKAGQLEFSFLGYKNKTIGVNELKSDNNNIQLEAFNIALGEVIVSINDAEILFKEVLNKIEKNYSLNQNIMNGFYRETIKKRKNYVSLSESIVEIEKQAYKNDLNDLIELFKGRKYTDYNKIDTLSFKLQGGPYTNLYLDIMKYPEIIFTDKPFINYSFNLENNTQIGDKKVYVISFKQRPQVLTPLYFGKLYIDTESLAVISASFNLNVDNKKAVSSLFTQKKPSGSEVYPTEALYQVNYRESNGKWLFAYSRADLIFRVNWDKKLFNSTYESTIELAVTDWKKGSDTSKKSTERLKQNVIMIDKVSDFADPDFWGEYNIIEPEKSIETAIKKIQKKL